MGFTLGLPECPSTTCRVFEYNPRTKTWNKLPDLNTGEHDTICAMDSKLLVLGCDDNAAEMFDLQGNISYWTETPNYKEGRLDPGAVALNGKIYVFAGDNDASVEMYDVMDQGIGFRFEQDQKWIRIHIMSRVRRLPGVDVLFGKIYVSGGTDQSFCDPPGHGKGHKSVECFDPVSNAWSKVADMNVGRFGHGLVSANGLLYAVGGFDDTKSADFALCNDSVLDSMEVYNPDTNTWTMLEEKIDGKVADSGACAVMKWELLPVE